MDLLSGIGNGLVGSLPPFLFVLTIVVFFHELGHFWVARRCGVQVEVFSIGFGPEIVGWRDSKGTRWRLAWIPLGGYVKFLGDEGAASTPSRETLARLDAQDRSRAFHAKPVGQRAAVVAAGPIANFILSTVIFAAIFVFQGQPIASPKVDGIQPASAAERAGFQPGDTIVSIDGTAIESFGDMQRIVSGSANKPLEVVVERGGSRETLNVTPELREMKDRFGNVYRTGVLGISRSNAGDAVEVRRSDPFTGLWLGAKETVFVAERTLDYIWGVIVGRESADQLGGPLRIAQVSGQVATLGIAALLQLTAVLSVSIGLMNLFPIPLLDGGHLLFYGIEALRGRPLSERSQEYGFRVGLALVLMLMIFATWNDIMQLRFL